MFNKLWISILILFLVSPVYADNMIRNTSPVISTVDSSELIIVPGTSTVLTKSIKVSNISSSESLGVMMRSADGRGVSNVTISLESGPYPPKTEGAVDEFYITSDTVATASYVDPLKWEMATIDTVIMPYIRFKIVGNSGNSQTTAVKMKVIK